MIDITEDTIDGAMFLRKCSRDEAIAWLNGPITDDEVEKFLTENPIYGQMIRALNLTINEKRQVVLRQRIWKADFARFDDANYRSQFKSLRI